MDALCVLTVLRTKVTCLRKNGLFWKLCIASCLFHGLAMLLTLPKRSLQTNPKAPEADALSFERSQSISTVSLPAGTLTAKDPVALAESDSLTSPSIDLSISPSDSLTAVIAQQPIPEEPLPAQVEQPIAPVPAAAPEVTPESSTPLQVQPAEPAPGSAQSANQNNITPVSALGSEPEYGKVMPLSSEFPDLEGAEAGCFGLEGCRAMLGNLHDIEQQLIAQLEANNYRLTKRDDIEDSGRRVFEVIAPDEPDELYYLNVFSSDIGKAVYVLTVDILSLVELQQLSQ